MIESTSYCLYASKLEFFNNIGCFVYPIFLQKLKYKGLYKLYYDVLTLQYCFVFKTSQLTCHQKPTTKIWGQRNDRYIQWIWEYLFPHRPRFDYSILICYCFISTAERKTSRSQRWQCTAWPGWAARPLWWPLHSSSLAWSMRRLLRLSESTYSVAHIILIRPASSLNSRVKLLCTIEL